MKSLLHTLRVLLILTVGAAGCLNAQNAAESAAPRPRPDTAGPIDVDFPGGTLADLNRQLAREDASRLNIVGEPASMSLQIPPFNLRNADPSALAMALDGLLRPRGHTLQPFQGPNGANSIVYLVSPRDSARDRAESGRIQSFQLGPYLTLQSIEDITTTIQMAWELDPTRDPVPRALKFHPPTKILIVSGSALAINTAAGVISQLALPPRSREGAPAGTPEPTPAPPK